ncbi:MAG: DUF2214 family protein [Gammaproteobacteria bacterium]|nr:DUF2214 family protein [Gammaproteobacteria bacterium]
MIEVFVRYAHFIGIIVLASMLVGEHMLLKAKISNQDAKRLAVIDAIYGISAIVVLLAGLTLWLWVGKPSSFYNSNPIFHAKLTLFVLMGLLSIYPTRFLLKHRNSPDTVIEVPKKVINIIRAELLILVIMPLLAVLMAHGYGNH